MAMRRADAPKLRVVEGGVRAMDTPEGFHGQVFGRRWIADIERQPCTSPMRAKQRLKGVEAAVKTASARRMAVQNWHLAPFYIRLRRGRTRLHGLGWVAIHHPTYSSLLLPTFPVVASHQGSGPTRLCASGNPLPAILSPRPPDLGHARQGPRTQTSHVPQVPLSPTS